MLGSVEKDAGGGADLHALTRAECMDLLATGTVGRVAVVRHVLPDPLPVVIPVNYTLDGTGAVVFRTRSSTVLHAAVSRRADAAFEVDELDVSAALGWSVLVSGPLRQVSEPGELAVLRDLPLVPWVAGEREEWLRLTPVYVSGRRVG